MKPPPQRRRLHDEESLTFAQIVEEIRRTYDDRNASDFEWAPD
jgi:hypothetical protein